MTNDLISRRPGDAPKRSLWDRIKDVALTDVAVLARGGVDSAALESLEQVLLEADLGVPVTVRLVDEVRRRASKGEVRTDAEFRELLRSLIEASLRAGKSDTKMRVHLTPSVVLVLGVNGAGKTTTIGKLAAKYRAEHKKVMLVAADTFRAGAVDQLRVWAERTGSDFHCGEPGADPAAVAWEGISAAISRGIHVLLLDTAGRLHTSDALMEELRKIHRVAQKRLEGAPHEALLVLDGTAGQNAVTQARIFAAAVPLTGLVVTKLDGTARGGVVVAAHEAIDVPVKFVGSGEAAEDLAPFDATKFSAELLEG
jgi:fused signal recognition particle receptor